MGEFALGYEGHVDQNGDKTLYINKVYGLPHLVDDVFLDSITNVGYLRCSIAVGFSLGEFHEGSCENQGAGR